MLAAQEKHLPLVDLFLIRGADPNRAAMAEPSMWAGQPCTWHLLKVFLRSLRVFLEAGYGTGG